MQLTRNSITLIVLMHTCMHVYMHVYILHVYTSKTVAMLALEVFVVFPFTHVDCITHVNVY